MDGKKEGPTNKVGRPVHPFAKKKLLEVAVKLFADRGYKGVTIREIAAAAEVNPANIGKYFGSKFGLYEEIIRSRIGDREITILHSAIDISKFYYRERKCPSNCMIKLVSVGRLKDVKGLQYSIQAVIKLLGKYKHITYDIVGEGKFRENLELIINKAKVAKEVEKFYDCLAIHIPVKNWNFGQEAIKFFGCDELKCS